MPTGAVPFPVNDDGERKTENGWKFHYNGWSNPTKPYRSGATTANMFPAGTEGCLDSEKLKKLGLTKARMQACDAAFFLQLILPFCDPAQSGVEDDPRVPYFTEVERFTNISKLSTGKGATYGHQWKLTTSSELVHFYGVLLRDGVKGSSQGAIHRRWQVGKASYDEMIAKSMTLTRFGEIKRSMKLKSIN